MVVTGLFLDLAKAFDSVDHGLLLRKLECAGIRGVTNQLFVSYLSNRFQYVSANGFDSSKLVMTFGVPQGSVLGPLLFLIFINDLYKLPITSKPYLYADDTSLFTSSICIASNVSQINGDLKLISEYFKMNKLTLNLNKCKVVHFRSPRKQIGAVPDIVVDGIKVESVASIKCLGIVLDSHLNWNCHVTELCNKISSQIGIIRR